MKISIVTVCKNPGNSLKKTVESVLVQTYQDIEYIIIDGVSTDGTVEWLTDRFLSGGKVEWSNGGDSTGQTHGSAPTHLHTYTLTPNLTLKFVSEPDSGIYQAMNKGIKMATGDYLLFLNAGDYLIHYNVVALVSEIIKDEKCDVAHGNCINVNPFSGEYSINKGTANYCPEFFYNNAMPHQAIFYKKGILIKFGFYDEKFKIISDNLLNKKIFCDKTVSKKYIDQIISVYFWDGISSQSSGHFGSIHNKERELFYKEGFNKKELTDIFESVDRREKIRIKKNKKSVLRFLSKLFRKFYEEWVNK
jgi:glycosyltransferase involved in cell wall biosynthesis